MEPNIVDENDLVPRAERPNPYGYTNLELAEKDKAVADMLERHPNIPPKWLEWLWDTWKRKGEDEMQRIIDSGEWDEPLVKRQIGGIIKDAMTVELGNSETVNDENGETLTDENGEIIKSN